MVICLERAANDLHMIQLMPLPPIISYISKIQNGLPFWCRLTRVVLEKESIKRMYCSSFSARKIDRRILLATHYSPALVSFV